MIKNVSKGFIIILLLLFLFAGCKSKIDTVMTINSDLSGIRIITCSISKQKIKSEINGNEAALDSLIELNCPSELSHEKLDDEYNVIYKFVLSFGSKDEYIKKIENLLGFKPNIVFESPNSPFTRGLIIKENFSSKDLLWWLEKIGKEKNLISSKNEFLTENSAIVNYNGKTIETANFINVRDIEYLRIDKVSIATDINSDGTFKRNISFCIPLGSFNSKSEYITNYMNNRVPQFGLIRSYDINDNKVFNIYFEAKDAYELLEKTNNVIDNNSGYITTHVEESNFFDDKKLFNEKIDLSSFVSSYTGKVYLEYEINFKDESKISKSEIIIDNDRSEYIDFKGSDKFIYFGEVASFETKISNRNECEIKNIIVNMNQLRDDSLKREILFEFYDNQEKPYSEMLKKYLNSLNLRFAQIKSTKTELKISLYGSAEEINFDLNRLLGENNVLKLETDNGFKMFNKAILEDQINLSSIIELVGFYNGQIKYSYSSSKKIDELSKRELGNADINVYSSYDEYGNLLLLPNSSSVITISCSKINYPFIIVCFIAISIFIAFVSIVLYKIVSQLKRNIVTEGIDGKKEIIEMLDVYCPECGTRVYKGAIYCRTCRNIVGTELEIKKNNGD